LLATRRRIAQIQRQLKVCYSIEIEYTVRLTGSSDDPVVVATPMSAGVRNSDQVAKVPRIAALLRAVAWAGVFAIFILSVVPADERPSTGLGQRIEHLAAFGLVAGAFAVCYRFTLIQLLLIALLFCGGIELLQVPLPTRHARVSDFVIDLLGSSLAIFLAVCLNRFTARPRQQG
jgi:hypothetical protein